MENPEIWAIVFLCLFLSAGDGPHSDREYSQIKVMLFPYGWVMYRSVITNCMVCREQLYMLQHDSVCVCAGSSAT